MAITILAVILSVFAIIGLTEFLHSLTVSFLSADECNSAMVIPICEETAVLRLKSVDFEHKWHGDKYADKIIAVYSELSPETLEICRKLTDNSNIILVPEECTSNVLDCIFNTWRKNGKQRKNRGNY